MRALTPNRRRPCRRGRSGTVAAGLPSPAANQFLDPAIVLHQSTRSDLGFVIAAKVRGKPPRSVA